MSVFAFICLINKRRAINNRWSDSEINGNYKIKYLDMNVRKNDERETIFPSEIANNNPRWYD